MKFTPLAASRTSAWSGPGAGVGTSTSSILSGSPGSLACMTFMIAADRHNVGHHSSSSFPRVVRHTVHVSSDLVKALLRFAAAARLDRVQLGVHTALREQHL